MKVSLNWLKQYVDIPKSISAEELALKLTMSTVEVEEIIDQKKNYENMVVGEVINVVPHPNADKLKLAKVDVGGKKVEIVCGGVNLVEGMKVAMALHELGVPVQYYEGMGDRKELAELGIKRIEKLEDAFAGDIVSVHLAVIPGKNAIGIELPNAKRETVFLRELLSTKHYEDGRLGLPLALGVPPMLLGIPGDNTYSNYGEAQRAFWRGTVLPLVHRMTRALSAWLAPAYGGAVELRADLDQVDGLSTEREALWARIERASFLTLDEKRAAVGYGPAPREEAAPEPSDEAAPSFGGKAGSFRGPDDSPAGSRPLAHFVKYNPDEPCVSAGNSDGGQ